MHSNYLPRFVWNFMVIFFPLVVFAENQDMLSSFYVLFSIQIHTYQKKNGSHTDSLVFSIPISLTWNC